MAVKKEDKQPQHRLAKLKEKIEGFPDDGYKLSAQVVNQWCGWEHFDMQVDKVEQTTSFRTLVFWAVQCPFYSGEEFQFGDYQIWACFEKNYEADAIRIETYDKEIPKQCLAELWFNDK